jgi:hypothetical protein
VRIKIDPLLRRQDGGPIVSVVQRLGARLNVAGRQGSSVLAAGIAQVCEPTTSVPGLPNGLSKLEPPKGVKSLVASARFVRSSRMTASSLTRNLRKDDWCALLPRH